MCLCQRGRWTDTKVSCCFKYQFFSFSFHFFCIKLLNSKPIDNQHSRLNIYVYAFSRRFHPKWKCKSMINDQIYSLTQPCLYRCVPASSCGHSSRKPNFQWTLFHNLTKVSVIDVMWERKNCWEHIFNNSVDHIDCWFIIMLLCHQERCTQLVSRC